MVFLSSPLWRRITFVKKTPDPDRFWKKRKILRMSAHFYGRKQNCYRFAVLHVHRALKKATLARDLRIKDLQELYEARLRAACEQHGFTYPFLKAGLQSSDIQLTNKVLVDLAIWEPRTFKCLTEFAWNRVVSDGLYGVNDLGDPPSGVILRPMIVK